METSSGGSNRFILILRSKSLLVNVRFEIFVNVSNFTFNIYKTCLINILCEITLV